MGSQMALGAILRVLTGPITDIINKSVKDKDLAAKLNHEIVTLMIQSDAEVTRQAGEIIQAEARGDSWLQRSWRPMTMIWFSVLLGLYWFGFAPDYLVEHPEVTQDLMGLLKIGIGGYIVGRSAEKISHNIDLKG